MHFLFPILILLQLGPSHPGARIASVQHGIWLSWQPSSSLVSGDRNNLAQGYVVINRATGNCTTNSGFSIVDTNIAPYGPWRDATAVTGTTYAYTIDYIDANYFQPDSGSSNCTSATAP